MTKSSTIAIRPAAFPGDRDVVRTLFTEYADGLGLDLSFQDFATELAGLPGKYGPPGGRILLAHDPSGCPLGCAALRPTDQPGTGEMKRLYVRPAARGQQLGRRLAEEILRCARAAGFNRVVLDTLATMHAAQQLYTAMGFQPIAPYYHNPLPGALYFAREL